jgi:hypothetical protein
MIRVFGLLTCPAAIIALLTVGRSGPASVIDAPASLIETTVTAQQSGTSARTREVAAGEAAARSQCVTCHRLPPPDVLPRGLWHDEVARMFLIQNKQPEPGSTPGTAARMVALPADWQAIVRYYEALSPARFPAPAKWPAPDRKLVFRTRVLTPPQAPPLPAVANVQFLDLDGDGRLEVVGTDMRNGLVVRCNPSDATPAFTEIARLQNPAHVSLVDFDQDGVRDLLVGDLGRFLPSDHHRGAVTWLRGRKDGTYAPMTLDGWARVSDVEAGDFDGDGRLDLAVAAFGWRRTGDFTVLRNNTTNYEQPSFAPFQIDKRAGSIHAIPVDLNGDGRLDVVTLFAQEHETVVAYLNTGPGIGFEPHTLYEAPHPNWGSSGIQVVDLDKDGDVDVLLTHGDSLDDQLLKPFHGIQWLENTGTYPFTEHTLAAMPGVHRAQAADLDGDGDLDIAACALVQPGDAAANALPAIVWLEQTKPGVFQRHTLEMGLPTHATLDLADYDRDGDIDLVVGNFSFGSPVSGWFELFENLKVRR